MTTTREHLIREAEGAAHRGQKQCPGCGEWFDPLFYKGHFCSHDDDGPNLNEDDWTEDR